MMCLNEGGEWIILQFKLGPICTMLPLKVQILPGWLDSMARYWIWKWRKSLTGNGGVKGRGDG